ncbi:hypothetical protein KEQ90_22340 [Escherichia coli]|uniref:Lipoprotein n=1 Tax=Escherichia coli TaxID=562 RepID=A0AAP6EDA6_ECOLX|nr:hypothetical protein [Escherichia coli]HDQ6661250.1 hypothetical protein [Escherichia coli O22:H16]HDQ6666543.1 hypothetical protein [Escherichia coli O166:H28]HDQ6896387.1 hypothetical protein [Escherichia coli O174:H8]MBF5824131.1 hypothetical protein [Escherichia coli]MBS8983772.1 hypothetical protein [Escherichia coli]
MKIILKLCFLMLLLSGCNDKAKDFIGGWTQESNEEYPVYITINYDSGIYHVDVKKLDTYLVEKKKADAFDDFMWGKKSKNESENLTFDDCYKVFNFEAKAISSSVLEGKGISVRMDGDRLIFDGKRFVKKKS